MRAHFNTDFTANSHPLIRCRWTWNQRLLPGIINSLKRRLDLCRPRILYAISISINVSRRNSNNVCHMVAFPIRQRLLAFCHRKWLNTNLAPFSKMLRVTNQWMCPMTPLNTHFCYQERRMVSVKAFSYWNIIECSMSISNGGVCKNSEWCSSFRGRYNHTSLNQCNPGDYMPEPS